MLNLIYYLQVRAMNEEDRKKFDQALARPEEDTPPVTHTSSSSSPAKVDGRTPPAWWRGDGAAAQSSIQAARDMGMSVGRIG